MKKFFIPMLTGASLLIATVLFYTTTYRQHDELDGVQAGLLKLTGGQRLPAELTFVGEPIKPQLYIWSRFLLAPRQLQPINTTSIHDTTLLIRYNWSTDSSVKALLATGKPYASVQDSSYQYLLVTGQ